jgi:LysR family transcriptional regulator, regulator for bpeEF and oprC
MEQFNDLAAFVAVAETKAFASAARRLTASTSGVSKSVNRLEKRLGVRLFTRTTRRVALTVEGEQFYARSRDILEALADAESELADASLALRGRIRIDMPIVYGERHGVPALMAFREQHPGVDLDIRLSDDFTNLVEEKIDLAIRFGELGDSRIKAKRLGIGRMVTCASPSYFARRGKPKTIVDLTMHDCIAYQFRSSQRLFNWRFLANGSVIEIEPKTSIIVNDGAAHRRLALLGAGIIQDLDYSLGEEIERGELVEVLSAHSTPAFPLTLVWAAGRYQARRVRALIDFLSVQLSG